MKHLTLATTVCSLLALTACEENNYTKQLNDSLNTAISSIKNQSLVENNPLLNTNNHTTTLAGKVADGYLIGAKVCLDKNRNDHCDLGEPHTLSIAGGNFKLQATPDEQSQYPIVAEISENTIDEDTNQAVGSAYTLSSPAAMKNEKPFISPISHMVHQTMKRDNSLSINEAKILIANKLDMQIDDIEGDFIHRALTEKNADKQARAKQLHNHARKLARAMAEATQKTQALSRQLPENQKNDVTALVMSTIESILPKILATKIQSNEGEIDFAQLTSSINQVIDSEAKLPNNITEMESAIIHQQDQYAFTPISIQQVLKEQMVMSHLGMSITPASEIQCLSLDCNQPALAIDAEIFSFDESGDHIKIESYTFNFNDFFLTLNKEEYTESERYLLSPQGQWVKENDNNCKLIPAKDNGDNAIVDCQNGLKQFHVKARAIDIEGRAIAKVVHHEFIPLEINNSLFPKGSKLIQMKTMPVKAMVALPIVNNSATCNEANRAEYAGNCNVIMMSEDNTIPAQQLEQVISLKEKPVFNVHLPMGIQLSLLDNQQVMIKTEFKPDPTTAINLSTPPSSSMSSSSNTHTLEESAPNYHEPIESLLNHANIDTLITQSAHSQHTINIGKWEPSVLNGQKVYKISFNLFYTQGMTESVGEMTNALYLVFQERFVRLAYAEKLAHIDEMNGLILNRKGFDAFIQAVEKINPQSPYRLSNKKHLIK